MDDQQMPGTTPTTPPMGGDGSAPQGTPTSEPPMGQEPPMQTPPTTPPQGGEGGMPPSGDNMPPVGQ